MSALEVFLRVIAVVGGTIVGLALGFLVLLTALRLGVRVWSGKSTPEDGTKRLDWH